MSFPYTGMATLLAAALILAPPCCRASGGFDSADACPNIIYVARRGWHVDVGFAVESLAAPLERVARKFPGVKYVFFGFGDRRYLMASHRTLPAMLRALWPGAGVILVTGLGATPEAAFGAAHVVALRVTAQQSLAAQRYLWASVADSAGDAAGQSQAADQFEVPTLAPGPYPGSLYLAASRGYSAVHTCNTWVAEVLRAAGLPVRNRGVVFAGQVWRRATKLAAGGSSRRPDATLNCRVASFRSDRPPSSRNRAAPPPWSSPAVADCCC